MQDHKLDLNNIERTWIDEITGFMHAICSCGKHMVGKDVMDVTRQFVEHTNDVAMS
jgi:hypothetical protein